MNEEVLDENFFTIVNDTLISTAHYNNKNRFSDFYSKFRFKVSSCFTDFGERNVVFSELLMYLRNKHGDMEISKAIDELSICILDQNESVMKLDFEFLKSQRRNYHSSEFHGNRDEEKKDLLLLDFIDEKYGKSLKVTVTDAQKLLSFLRFCDDKDADINLMSTPSSHSQTFKMEGVNNSGSLKISHHVFGGAYGIFNTDMYLEPYSECIRCLECPRWYNTYTFTSHTHKWSLKNTLDWGYDSTMWRHYLHVSSSYNHLYFLTLWEEIKTKFYDLDEKHRILHFHQIKHIQPVHYHHHRFEDTLRVGFEEKDWQKNEENDFEDTIKLPSSLDHYDQGKCDIFTPQESNRNDLFAYYSNHTNSYGSRCPYPENRFSDRFKACSIISLGSDYSERNIKDLNEGHHFYRQRSNRSNFYSNRESSCRFQSHQMLSCCVKELHQSSLDIRAEPYKDISLNKDESLDYHNKSYQKELSMRYIPVSGNVKKRLSYFLHVYMRDKVKYEYRDQNFFKILSSEILNHLVSHDAEHEGSYFCERNHELSFSSFEENLNEAVPTSMKPFTNTSEVKVEILQDTSKKDENIHTKTSVSGESMRLSQDYFKHKSRTCSRRLSCKNEKDGEYIPSHRLRKHQQCGSDRYMNMKEIKSSSKNRRKSIYNNKRSI